MPPHTGFHSIAKPLQPFYRLFYAGQKWYTMHCSVYNAFKRVHNTCTQGDKYLNVFSRLEIPRLTILVYLLAWGAESCSLTSGTRLCRGKWKIVFNWKTNNYLLYFKSTDLECNKNTLFINLWVYSQHSSLESGNISWSPQHKHTHTQTHGCLR